MIRVKNVKLLLLLIIIFFLSIININRGNAVEFDGTAGELPAIEIHSEADKPFIYGNVVQIFEPSATMTTINFDDAAHHDCVNTRYISQGIEFRRDDDACVHAFDWAALGRITTTPPMVVATTKGPGAPVYVNHLNLIFSQDTYKIGAYIGNDQRNNMIWTLEIFDVNDNLIGLTSLISNGNTHVDEYLGLTSSDPIRRARYSNNVPSLSVVLDDVSFSSSSVIDPLPDIKANGTTRTGG
jgi:hypothetical protein